MVLDRLVVWLRQPDFHLSSLVRYWRRQFQPAGFHCLTRRHLVQYPLLLQFSPLPLQLAVPRHGFWRNVVLQDDPLPVLPLLRRLRVLVRQRSRADVQLALHHGEAAVHEVANARGDIRWLSAHPICTLQL